MLAATCVCNSKGSRFWTSIVVRLTDQHLVLLQGLLGVPHCCCSKTFGPLLPSAHLLVLLQGLLGVQARLLHLALRVLHLLVDIIRGVLHLQK